jgi:hypothetical protein
MLPEHDDELHADKKKFRAQKPGHARATPVTLMSVMFK